MNLITSTIHFDHILDQKKNMLGDRKTVVLRGGSPWGFRLSGGKQIPVYIAKVLSFFCFDIVLLIIKILIDMIISFLCFSLNIQVRSHSKAAQGGLAAGDTLISVNGLPSLQQSLREINDVIDTIRGQLVLEVQRYLRIIFCFFFIILIFFY